MEGHRHSLMAKPVQLHTKQLDCYQAVSQVFEKMVPLKAKLKAKFVLIKFVEIIY